MAGEDARRHLEEVAPVLALADRKLPLELAVQVQHVARARDLEHRGLRGHRHRLRHPADGEGHIHLEVRTGTTISWENPTSNLHSITEDGCRRNETCAFDSGPIGPNQTFTLVQLPPGQYSYHCSYHPIMRGVLVVVEQGLPEET